MFEVKLAAHRSFSTELSGPMRRSPPERHHQCQEENTSDRPSGLTAERQVRETDGSERQMGKRDKRVRETDGSVLCVLFVISLQ